MMGIRTALSTSSIKAKREGAVVDICKQASILDDFLIEKCWPLIPFQKIAKDYNRSAYEEDQVEESGPGPVIEGFPHQLSSSSVHRHRFLHSTFQQFQVLFSKWGEVGGISPQGISFPFLLANYHGINNQPWHVFETK